MGGSEKNFRAIKKRESYGNGRITKRGMEIRRRKDGEMGIEGMQKDMEWRGLAGRMERRGNNTDFEKVKR